MGTRREKHPFEDNPFVGGLLDWMDSPEEQRSIEVFDTLWELIDNVQLDARRRELIWPEAQRLSLEQFGAAHPHGTSALPLRAHRKLPDLVDREPCARGLLAEAIRRA